MADRGPVVEVIIKAKDLASNVVAKFRRQFQSIGRVVKDVTQVVAGFTVAVGAALLALTKLTQQGAKIVGVKRAFAKGTNYETDALEKLRKASAGTIDDFTLMSRANAALALGAAKTTDQFAEMVRLSKALGRAQGIDATEALDTFTTGLARQSRQRLDDLGITITAQKANEAYAKQLGVSADKLTVTQQKEAFRNETLRIANELVEKMSAGSLKGAAAGERLAAAWKNIGNRFAEASANSEMVASFEDSITNMLQDVIDLFGGNAETWKDAMKALGAMLGNAFGAAWFEAAAGVLNFVDEKILKILHIDKDKWTTIFGYVGETLKKMGDSSIEAAVAWREALAAAAVAARNNAAASKRGRGGAARGGGGGGGGGVAAALVPGMAGTPENLAYLLKSIRDTAQQLKAAKLDEVLAAPGDAADQAAKKVAELSARLAQLRQLAQPFGGELGLQTAALEARGFLPGLGNARYLTTAAGTQQHYRLTGAQGLTEGGIRAPTVHALTFNEQTKQLQRATGAMKTAEAVAVSSFFGMAQAAVAGSQQVAQSVVGMITQILQSVTHSTILGAVIGGVGGLIGAAFGRHNAPVPVQVADYSSKALDQLNKANQRPIHLTNITETGGVETSRIEKELYDRQDRDELVRFPVRKPGG